MSLDEKQIEEILKQIQQGKRCYCSSEDDEVSIILSLEQNSDGLYLYHRMVSQKYDVVAPTHYDKRILNESELKAALHEETFERISYVDQDLINENTRRKADFIYSHLKQRAKLVYVVFQKDRWQNAAGKSDTMHFSGLYRNAEQAQSMVEYLRAKQGAQSYWKPVTLSFQGIEGQEISFHGDLAAQDQLTAKQILATLLGMKEDQIDRFFED